MKKTKVIIPALGILLLSTAASVTGTVAWFTTNNTVSASSMAVKAVVNGNLNIVKGSAATLNEINLLKVEDLGVSEQALIPVDISDEKIATEHGVQARIPATYAADQDPTVSSAGKAATWTELGIISATANNANTASAKYVATGYVSIANKSNPASTFLLHPTVEVTVFATDTLAGALRAGMVIATDDNSYCQYFESGDASVADTKVTLAFTSFPTALVDNTPYRVSLNIWYEGEDSQCFVNNAVNVANSTAVWSFSSAE